MGTHLERNNKISSSNIQQDILQKKMCSFLYIMADDKPTLPSSTGILSSPRWASLTFHRSFTISKEARGEDGQRKGPAAVRPCYRGWGTAGACFGGHRYRTGISKPDWLNGSLYGYFLNICGQGHMISACLLPLSTRRWSRTESLFPPLYIFFSSFSLSFFFLFFLNFIFHPLVDASSFCFLI